MSARVRCDVLVAGGGPAGVAAAVAAASRGARVTLIERGAALGGSASQALVHTVCGLYASGDDDHFVPVNRGLPVRWARELVAGGASPGPLRMGRLGVLPHDPAGFAALCHQACVTAGVTVRLGAGLHGILPAGDILCAEVRTAGLTLHLEAWQIVDASGDAVVADLLGAAERATPARLQRPAYVFGLTGVDLALLDDSGHIRLLHRVARAVATGRLGPAALGAQFRAGARPGELMVTLDLAAAEDYDPTDDAQLAALKNEGHQVAMDLAAFLREAHDAFAQATTSAFPARVGVRESRRARGEERVTGDDIRTGRDRADGVARSAWPMELRETNRGPRWIHPEGDRPASVPLGALRLAGMSNVWVAGRCVSCDHEAQAALRVIGTGWATGQAAGLAAALAADGCGVDADAVRRLIPELERGA